MKQPILSILIPTYNRARLITKTLDSITSQINNKTINDIEIVITNDGSKDDTEKIIESYQKNNPCNIVYFKNEKNLGFDKNLINTVNKAQGKYCWFIGDDDLLYNNVLSGIIKKLKDNEKNKFLMLNYSRMDTKTEKIIVKKMIEFDSKKFGNINNFFFKASYSSKFPNMGMNLIYLSIFIFNREHWLKYVNNCKKYIGINFIHTFIFLHMLAKKDTKITYIGQPSVIYRSGNARDWGNDIWLSYHAKLLPVAKSLRLSKIKIYKLQFKYFTKYIKSKISIPIKKFILKYFKI
ncbi:glycosyltransferase family 2 protein [Candidatus Parcubacteria bacterium]|nr:glycosyltransferase family 2 protein [Candidatus Parcubacteria bacterium]